MCVVITFKTYESHRELHCRTIMWILGILSSAFLCLIRNRMYSFVVFGSNLNETQEFQQFGDMR